MTCHKFFGDETERRRWQNPEAILSSVGLKRGYTFVDVGCGTGFFALPAAKIVGIEGKVYAIDVDAEAIDMLNKEVTKQSLENVTAIIGEAEEIVVCKGCADVTFFGIVLHDFHDPNRVLSNAKLMLKPTGLLVDLDWEKKTMRLGPPLRIRFSRQEAINRIEEAGFKIVAVREAGPHHYMVTAKP
jgi:ubiquinone/menaquinone biosynthesis C-methylase UbiE